MANDIFHAGERAVQDRAGARALADRVGRSIRAALPPMAQEFLDNRRWLVVGGLDADNRPWATILAGPRGFVHVVGDRSVRVAAAPRVADPLDEALQPGAPAGFIAIDLATRRRFRLNGRIAARTASGLVVEADQAYSNCPQYIQRRDEAGDEVVWTSAAPARTSALTDEQRARLRGADTFFIASAAPGAGVDASHRGGMPGFITVEGQRITWPDYPGNGLFNTLGNIEAWPHAGLLVPHFDTGAGLLVTGRAAIDWDSSHLAGSPGAERLVTLDVEAVVEIAGILPTRLRLREYSPTNPR